MNDKKSNLRWLVFDGKIEDAWSMPLVNALDEERKLILKNRNSMSIHPNNTIFFESDDIKDANP